MIKRQKKLLESTAIFQNGVSPREGMIARLAVLKAIRATLLRHEDCQSCTEGCYWLQTAMP